MSVITTTIPAELDRATPARPFRAAATRAPSRRPVPPAHRADLLHQLILDVHADVGDYCNLRDLLEAQFEAALRHDTTRLTDIGNAMTGHVLTLDTRRRTRLALVRQLSLHDPDTPAAMLALFGQGPRQVAESLWHTLEGLARECQLINTRNGRLLQDQYTTLQRVLDPRAGELRCRERQLTSAAFLPHDAFAPDWLSGSTRLQRLLREDAALDQYRDNIDLLTARLHQAQARLDGIADDLLTARQLISRTCASGVVAADLARSASSLKALYRRLGAPAPTGEAPQGNDDELWVADGTSHRMQPAPLDIAALIAPLAGAIQLFEQPERQRDAVAWRVEIDRTLLDLDAAFDGLNGGIASLANARNRLQALSDNHTNVSLSNKHLAMSLGQLDDAAAALLLQGHELALHTSQRAQQALAGLSLFDAG